MVLPAVLSSHSVYVYLKISVCELLDVKVVVQIFYPRLRYYVYACAKKNAKLCSASSPFSCSLDILLLFL